jgi:CRP-like cAMP-binding protein
MPHVDVAKLSTSPLLESLLPAELESLARLFSVKEAAAGEVVIREGDVGDSMFIIASGVLEVLVGTDGGEVVVGTLGEGEFFGELSLIDKEPRSATVRAREQSVLYALTQDALHGFAKKHRNGFTWVMVNVARGLAHKLREANRKLAER